MEVFIEPIEQNNTNSTFTISKLLTILNKLDKKILNIDNISDIITEGATNTKIITSITTKDDFNSTIKEAETLSNSLISAINEKTKIFEIMFQIKTLINEANFNNNISYYIQEKTILNKKLTVFKNILFELKKSNKTFKLQKFEDYKAQLTNDNTAVYYTHPIVTNQMVMNMENIIDKTKNKLDEINDTIAHLNHSIEITLPNEIVNDLKNLKIIS